MMRLKKKMLLNNMISQLRRIAASLCPQRLSSNQANSEVHDSHSLSPSKPRRAHINQWEGHGDDDDDDDDDAPLFEICFSSPYCKSLPGLVTSHQ